MLLHQPRVAAQTWVHSCCSLGRLEAALKSHEVTAIETDIILAEGVPVMAHPPARSSDLSFDRFLELVLAEGTKHIKLDFKMLEAVEPCLLALAQVENRLRKNGQAVWLNADIVPGPNHRRSKIKITAAAFLPLCRRLCPFALLSLGWVVAPIGPEEAYTMDDARQMERICEDNGIPGHQVVFSAALRFAELNPAPMISLLNRIPDAQLVLWTGTGEVPVRPIAVNNILSVLGEAGVADRTGFDVALAATTAHVVQSLAVDCTFWFSRTVRSLCCTCGMVPDDIRAAVGEREPLFDVERAVASPQTPKRSSIPQESMVPSQEIAPIRQTRVLEIQHIGLDTPQGNLTARHLASSDHEPRYSPCHNGSATGSSPRDVFALNRS